MQHVKGKSDLLPMLLEKNCSRSIPGLPRKGSPHTSFLVIHFKGN